MPLLDESLRHEYAARRLHEFEIVLAILAHKFLGRAYHLLQIQVHLLIKRLCPQARVCSDTVLADFASLNHLFKEFKCLTQPVEEDVVCVVGPLGFVRILKVEDVKALEIQSLERLFQLNLKESWM